MNLHLNLKGEYFDAIKSGDKKQEYRVFNDYWKKRLIGKEYTEIIIKKGYPKRGDLSKMIKFIYRGFDIITITHPHFDNVPTKVFAITLEP